MGEINTKKLCTRGVIDTKVRGTRGTRRYNIKVFGTGDTKHKWTGTRGTRH